MNKKAVITIVCVALLGLGALTVAQDDTPVTIFDGYTGSVITFQDPDPLEVEGLVVPEGNLEAVTGDSASWYGHVVTLEGEIGNFISPRMFTLGEGAALDNDQVLVVNNSTHAFPPEIMQHARVRVTGRIHPSWQAIQEGAPVAFGDLFGRDVDNVNGVDTSPDTSTDSTASFQGDFTMLDSSLSSYGFVVTEDHVSNLQELDRNLETLTEEQRMQLADALEQDALVNEVTYPIMSQSFRDAATALRNNDPAGARTALQTSVMDIQSQMMAQPTPESDTSADTSTDTSVDTSGAFQGNFTALNNALTTHGFTVGEDHVANLQQLDMNLETLTEEQRMQLADALDQDATANEITYPIWSQSFRDTATALRNNDVAGARTSLQAAVMDIQSSQSMLQPTTDAGALPTTLPDRAGTDRGIIAMDFTRPNMVDWIYQGFVPDALNNFTILEVFSVDNVDFLEFAPGVAAVEG